MWRLRRTRRWKSSVPPCSSAGSNSWPPCRWSGRLAAVGKTLSHSLLTLRIDKRSKLLLSAGHRSPCEMVRAVRAVCLTSHGLPTCECKQAENADRPWPQGDVGRILPLREIGTRRNNCFAGGVPGGVAPTCLILRQTDVHPIELLLLRRLRVIEAYRTPVRRQGAGGREGRVRGAARQVGPVLHCVGLPESNQDRIV